MKTIFKTGLLAATVLTATSVYGDPSSEVSFASCDSGVCTISGTIDQDYTMVAGTDYVLSGTVKVGNGNGVISSASEMSAIQAAGVTLTIEPGVDVKGSSDGILLVTRGSKLVADGTASAPITFSSLDADYDGMGEWGGIVVQGFAPQYGAGGTGACFADGEAWCNVEGEGGTTIANYGGNLPADNSGVIRYVRIAEGGLVAGPNNEVNGLTLQGVGHGTQISHVQVHGNLDDGIEWFGGTANVTHAVLTNNDDDDIDFDEGFKGNIQYALVIKRQDEGAVPVGSNDPRGLELNSSDEDYVPETAGSVANVTVIGGDAANSKSEFGMRIRGSVTANIYNSAVAGYDNTCARIDDSDHDGSSATAKIDTPATFTNFLCDTAGTAFLKEQPADGSSGIVLEGINFDSNLAITNASASVAATTIAAVDNGSGFVFDSTDYVGAVKAGETPWYEGWTLPGTVSAPSVNNYDFASCDSGVCTISGTIDQDYTMVAGTDYVLSGTVKVGNGNGVISSASEMSAIQAAGVTLTIEPGVDVKGSSDGILLVTRGSKLVADGTASAPITFSSLDADYDGMGEWGGIVVQGFAPQYGAGGTGACFADGEAWCNVEGEGGTTIANYGGNLPADNSGVIRYVRIAEGGLVAGPNNEVNGLTLQGVGHGTQISHVQVHGNLDDGIEWFGGTANVTHAVLTNNDDDDIDFDEGFKGNIQYALVIKRQDEGAVPVGSNDPRGLELNSSDEDYVPETAGSVANVTVIGGDAANSKSEFGMRIRGSVTANIYNSAVAGYDNTCARIDDSDHDGSSATAKIDTPATFTNFLCDTAGTAFLKEQPADGSSGIVLEGINFDSNLAITNASASVAATTIAAVDNGSGFVFDSTDYVGAVKAGETPWYEGWTLPGTVSAPSVNNYDFASCDSGVCTISGTIDQDYTMVAGTDYVLSGTVKVGNGNGVISSASEMSAIQAAGVTLTIEPGVDVKGSSDGILLVTRGSKLVADGTASAPITFSSLDADYDGMGEWGGIVVQGFAPQYGAGGTGACFADGEAWCNVEGEGGTTIANYGGNLPADNSGVIRYVRIAEGGLVAGPNNEVNGLTLQGVGHGTQISHVQVHGNLDDGIEWFGGTANVTHAVLTNNDDDDIDFDEGFKGNIQYALVIKRQDEGAVPVGSNDPRGLELNSSDEDYVPETAGSVANVTVIGGDAANSKSEFGMRIRGSVTANIYNSAVAGYDNTCARIDDSDHDGSSATAKIDTPATFTNFLCDTAGTAFLKEQPADGSSGIVLEGINFDSNLAITNASASVAATTIAAVDNGSGFVFDSTDYVGAVKAGETPWYEGWTLPGTIAIAPAAPSYDFASCDSGVCTISGTIDQDYTMVAGTDYVLSGTVKVGNGNGVISSASEMSAIQAAGVTLTIEPGVDVKGSSDGILLVTRGSKLVADGTASAPITFSSLDADYDGMGEWGGIVVQGFAPQYGAGGTGACFADGEAWCNVEGEGGTTIANYGGNLPADNSGVIRYVRIAEGGLVAGPNNEVNGLTLQGVGHGTQISHVQVHGNLDDGIEWFGGTANVTHAVLTNNDDDDIDFDEGFKGNIQYALVIKRQDEGAVPVGSNDPRGLELNSSDEDYVPETAGSVANVTVIGGDAANSKSEFGMRIRGSVTANIYNSAVAGYDNTCARIDDSDHDGSSATAKIDTPATFTNFLCDTAGTAFLKEQPADGSSGIVLEGINFDSNLAITNASASVAATTIAAVDNGSGFVFDSTDYVGAVKAGETPWYEGWTLPGTVSAPSVNNYDFASCDSGVCTISGTIDQDYTMVAGTDYVLSGTVKVGNGNGVISSASEMSAIQAAGVTLTIEPGVDVKGSSDGILLVTRGSKLVADGTASAPITFSSLDADYDGMGEWGGIVVQGFAPQYGAGGTGACFADGEAWCNVEGEGGTTIANYGGNLPADNSGVIRYVRIAEGGLVAGPNNEVNGLTLQGVGHGTQISHVQVHGNLDDGIEWFGGTANVTHAVLTNNDDDDIDFDEGFKGNIQYALVIKRQDEGAVPVGSNDPRGLELNSSDEDYVPETAGSVANVTVIGGDAANSKSEFGMRIRGSVTANIYNSAVAGYDNTCARIDDSDHDGSSATAKIDTPATFTNFLCDTAGTAFLKEQPADGSSGIVLEGINFDSNLAITNASASVAATTIAAVDNGSGFVFDSTDYVGAVKAGETPWYEGWTLPGTIAIAPAAPSYDFASCDSGVCTISGTIDQDYTMVAGTDYVLSGTVKVGNGNGVISSASEMSAIQAAGVTLTIEPGVDVKGSSDGILLVTRGSKLVADGTASAPITFSSLDADYDGMGEWGGIVVQGFAPQYGAGGTGACFADGEAWCNVEGEGGTTIANYGGNLPADNSGVIRYVRIAEGGLVAGPNNEVNGLTLQGVGHGTQISHVQVHGNLDDGIEWFGGTANVTHALLTNNDDDDIDFDEGFKGNIQYALVIKRQDEGAVPVGSNDPRGLELNSSDEDYVIQTAGSVANVTVIGGDAANSKSEFGMRIRGSVTANIYNSAVTRYDNTCARIDDSDHDGSSATAKIDTPATFTNFLCDTVGTPFLKEAPTDASSGIVYETVEFDSNLAITNASASVAATTIAAVDNGSGFVFDSTDYIGAVKAGETPWYEGWALPGTVPVLGAQDTDGDGVPNSIDAFPNDASETEDTDGDGVGDNADAFPNDASETADSDNDGVGDNADFAPNDPNVQEGPKQLVYVDGDPSALLGQSVSISVGYDVSDNDPTLTGLGLRVHFNSSILTFVDATDVLTQDNISSPAVAVPDIEDYDNDPSTDMYVDASWASLFGSWPGTLPASLMTLNFNVAEDVSDEYTRIDFSSTSNTAGYTFAPIVYDMPLLAGSWDFDNDGNADALTDGLLLLRYTFGLIGASLTDSAIASGSPLTPAEVEANVAAAATSFADIDGNGNVDALTDGLMLLRYLFGLTGASLIDSAVAADAERTTAADIEAYIQSLIP